MDTSTVVLSGVAAAAAFFLGVALGKAWERGSWARWLECRDPEQVWRQQSQAKHWEIWFECRDPERAWKRWRNEVAKAKGFSPVFPEVKEQ